MSFRSNIRRLAALGLAPVLSLSVLSACGNDPAGAAAECNGLPEQPTISFAAYSTPREAYGKIISAFKSAGRMSTTARVIFQESYDASTPQAPRVVGGTRPTSWPCPSDRMSTRSPMRG